MDSVSRLLAQAQPSASMDTRCLLPAGAQVVHEPATTTAAFHLVIDGRCDVRLADRTVHLRAGDFLLLARGQRHEVRVGGAGGEAPVAAVTKDHSGAITRETVPGATPAIDLFCGHYAFEMGAGTLFLAGVPELLHVNLTASAGAEVGHLVALLRATADGDQLGAAVMLDSLAQVLLVMALQVSPSSESPSVLKVSDPAVAAVIEAVVADPGQKWTVERLARLSHTSRATLVRRFRRDTGTTIADFVTWVRVMHAADLLRTSGHSVTSVGELVGYSSPSAFSRAFQSAIGTSPGRFGRQRRG